ncbi:hypothetical protein [Marinobacter sp. P4B1]|uniref:hypothetical protein n=1 Tax=Marinobacter sp. P4B1 TaxID=1119533 RepID=UPI00071D3B91|nr:hypothetical protein [Marinobacter sp. P4B1]KRW81894.1 hypothetical protein AQ621_12590 [Marinobacter sp. P4B1]
MTQTKQGNFKKKLLALAVLAPAMAITACSNDGAYIPGEEAGEKAGVAYDGYLRGATVCADVNLNKQCDEDDPNTPDVNEAEPSTTTGEGGFFLLTGLTPAQERYPLALEAIAGVTVDEDTGEAVTENFNYVAPAGATTVSGFSTIIQVETERLIAEGSSPAAAEAKAKADLAAALGAPEGTDLANFDAVAVSKANGSDSNLATQLRVVNQVITKQLVAAVAQANSSVTGASAGAILAAATNKVTEKVAVIKQVVDAKLAEGGVTGPDITGEQLAAIADEAVADNTTAPEAVTVDDVNDAAEAITAAQEVIKEAIAEETQEEQEPAEEPGTGATGATGGGQGAA